MGSIIISLGGGGKVASMKLRRMMVEEYGGEEYGLLKNKICFLHIDTFKDVGQEGGQDFCTRVMGTDISLKEETERLVLSDNLPEPPQTAMLTNHPHVKEWFSEILPCNIDLSQGAGGVRAYGRIAFHHKIFLFRQRLNQMLSRAQTDTRVNIYIVCSLFGGTGSGTFLDVCYAARDEKNRRGLKGDVLGFFIIGASNPDAGMKENCYAALAELEYYSSGPLLQEGRKNKPFEARYPVSGVTQVISDEPPVDTCYLFGNNNGQKLLERSELEEMTARRIFFETVSGIKEPMTAKRADIKATPAYYMPEGLQKRSKTFFATGCSVIEFPAPRIMNALGAAFAAYCCDYLLFKEAEGFSDLKKEMKEFMEDRLGVNVRESSLRKTLELQDTRTIGSSMKEDRFTWQRDLKDKISHGAVKEGTIYGDIEKVVGRAVDSINGKGACVLTIKNNLEKLWKGGAENEGLQQRIMSIISAFILDRDKGPAHTGAFLDSLSGN